jgi:hypothetical protein
MTTSHPASRVLLLYAAALAVMLVTAIAIAAMRDAPAATADDTPVAAQSASKSR